MQCNEGNHTHWSKQPRTSVNCQLEEQVGSIYTALVSPIFALSSLHLSKFQWIYSRIIYARTEGLAL